RLGRYDDAFKHLRTAHEMEEPKNYLTAGYLALCGAKGKPTRPEDKDKNVAWAVWLVSQFQAPGDREWADLLNQIFAEARSLRLPVPVPDQVRLCEALAAVDATDPVSAAGFAHLAETLARQKGEPETQRVFRPEYAWLYGRAAQQHGATSEADL